MITRRATSPWQIRGFPTPLKEEVKRSYGPEDRRRLVAAMLSVLFDSEVDLETRRRIEKWAVNLGIELVNAAERGDDLNSDGTLQQLLQVVGRERLESALAMIAESEQT